MMSPQLVKFPPLLKKYSQWPWKRIGVTFFFNFSKEKCFLRGSSNFPHFQKNISRWTWKEIRVNVFLQNFRKKHSSSRFLHFQKKKISMTLKENWSQIISNLKKQCFLCSSSNFLHFQKKSFFLNDLDLLGDLAPLTYGHKIRTRSHPGVISIITHIWT